MLQTVLVLAAICGLWCAHLGVIAGDDLTMQLRELKTEVFSPEQAELLQPGEMLERNIVARMNEANRRSTDDWNRLESRAEWEKFRNNRIEKLKQSLGTYPEPPIDLHVRVVGTAMGTGYRVENLLFESRPGLFVAANLYLPEVSGAQVPGIILCHSHHAPKSEVELQHLGQSWARQGCLVLVPELPGHGERRDHPFHTQNDFPESFRIGRQDYYFRYVLGMQLHALGDSLAGWFVWDLHRSVDYLLSRPEIDPERIILLGAVAGGGDPAAVAAALDHRIDAVVPFNFGGPQPETTYPLPDDAEKVFNYAGGGSWESTRNLTGSARDGFLPWVIVGSVAPCGLIYAHEFNWDRPRDPVWKRLEKIYGWYDSRDRLDSVFGAGSVRGKSANDTHCTNIGTVHRHGIDPAFSRWFRINPPADRPVEKRSADELACWTSEWKSKLNPEPLHLLAKQLGKARIRAALEQLESLDSDQRRKHLRDDWTRILGNVEPAKEPRVAWEVVSEIESSPEVTVYRVALEVEPGLIVPVLLLRPASKEMANRPCVVAFAQSGKQLLLNLRAGEYAKLLSAGVAICLVDLRGTGETAPNHDSRGRGGPSTDLSSTELMLGETLLGARLRDLRTVLVWLRQQKGVDPERIALWGDSCTPPNPPEHNVKVPLDLDQSPVGEPLGGLLALLAGLYEPELRAISAHGGLSSYLSLLESPLCRTPHDILVPGAIAVGDLGLLAASRAPRPLQLTSVVNSLNQLVEQDELVAAFAPAVDAYRSSPPAGELCILPDDTLNASEWLRIQLLRK